MPCTGNSQRPRGSEIMDLRVVDLRGEATTTTLLNQHSPFTNFEIFVLTATGKCSSHPSSRELLLQTPTTGQNAERESLVLRDTSTKPSYS